MHYSEPEFRIGAALSDHSCVIYSIGESLRRIITLDYNQAPIVGIKFSPTCINVLYTATNDGKITVCDLRAKEKVVADYKGKTAISSYSHKNIYLTNFFVIKEICLYNTSIFMYLR